MLFSYSTVLSKWQYVKKIKPNSQSMEHKKKKKYVIIIKSQKQFYKYRVDNIVKTRAWLNNKMPDWLYCNIFDNVTKEYKDNITKHKYSELEETELKNWNHYED